MGQIGHGLEAQARALEAQTLAQEQRQQQGTEINLTYMQQVHQQTLNIAQMNREALGSS